ncbi:hypothetical protein B0H16DRAFT_1804948 [Mycena metata]|uniref:Zn(2)-C6 fungal-type domain-containing protein n=1 Tax=Mycena metata TaxID=1033252 RepID=A0AAD7H9N8_9AGAR|nr:hypothetical protein B0H16DRAFT_1804948 [Mycena metata]
MATQSTSSSDVSSLDGGHAPPESKIKEYEFWIRVARLMTRTRLEGKNEWIGSNELVEWNRNNLGVCARCKGCSVPRKCVIDDGHPSCRTCRTAKAKCERKTKYIFDLTKDDYYPDFETFHAVYKKGPHAPMTKFKAVESRKKRRILLKATHSPPDVSIENSPNEPLPICEICARMYNIHNATAAPGLHRVMSIHTPEGIEYAPEFEDIRLEIRAIQIGLASVWSKLGSLYLGNQGQEEHLAVVRELMRKFCDLQEATRNPTLQQLTNPTSLNTI